MSHTNASRRIVPARATVEGLVAEAPLLPFALALLAGAGLARVGWDGALAPAAALACAGLAGLPGAPRRGLLALACLWLGLWRGQPETGRAPRPDADPSPHRIVVTGAVRPLGGERWRFEGRLAEPGVRPIVFRGEGRGAAPDWPAGLPVALTGRLAAPDALRNFGRPPAPAPWRLTIKSARLGEPLGPPPSRPLDGLRARLARAVATLPLGDELRAAGSGMLLGGRDGVRPALRGLHQRLSTYHLFIVSGLQFGLAILLIGWLVRAPGLPPRCADALQLAFLALYFALLPGEVAVRRAACFGALTLLARLTGRERPALNGWAAALALEVLASPATLFGIGFQLSYLATLALVLAPARAVREDEPAGRLRRWGGAPLRVFGWLLPVQSALGPLPLLGPLANAWAFVWSAPLLLGLWSAVLLQLAGLDGCARIAALAARGCWRALHAGLVPLDRLDWRLPAQAWPLALALGYWLALALAVRAGRRWTAALLGIAALGFTLLRPAAVPLPSGQALLALDAGQGDALLLSGGGRRILVDAGRGGAVPSLYAALATHRVLRLDACALTHQDADHAGGMAALMNRFSCRELWIPAGSRHDFGMAGALEIAAARGIPVRTLRRGRELPWAGGTLAVLWPPAAPPGPPNDRGLVLRWRGAEFSALLTGDIEAETEFELARLGGLRSDLLKVAHHGSKTSSMPEFLAAAAPALGVIPVGRYNGYGHPHPAALARLRDLPLVRTDRRGALLVTRAADGGWRIASPDGVRTVPNPTRMPRAEGSRARGFPRAGG